MRELLATVLRMILRAIIVIVGRIAEGRSGPCRREVLEPDEASLTG